MYICVVRARVCVCVYVRSTIIRECSLKLRKNEEKGERTREEGREAEREKKEKRERIFEHFEDRFERSGEIESAN